MAASDTLQTAIERVYAAFADVPCPTRLHASPVQDADAIFSALTAAPLRQLDAEHLTDYASSALTTIGNQDDYRHFLPRLLELAVRDASVFGTEPQVIAHKLVYGAWTSWAPAERDAVTRLFGVATTAAIEWPPYHCHNAEDWLCGLAQLGIAPDPWLARWRTAALPNAGAQLAHLVSGIVHLDGGMFTAYWEGVSPEIKTTIADWLFDPATGFQLIATRPLVEPEDDWDIALALQALGRGERQATRH